MKIGMSFMNKLTRWFLAALAALIFIPSSIPASLAQMSAPPAETRVLLIFDTSAAMKKRVPNEVKAIKQLFALALAERLQNGDSIGVWTFNTDVHTGEFPLMRWQVQNITPTSSAVISFIQAQHYSKTTSFDKLTPLINHVVQSSPQLLIVIFCDGDGQFTGTPFDNSINASFKEHVGDMRKAHEPFVIALRGENGQYSGSTISSAEEMNIPHFAPLSPSPQFAPPQMAAPALQPPQPAQAAPPPLIIIGNSAGTKPLPPQPAPDLIIKGTNHMPEPPAASPQKNTIPQSSVVPETNPVPPVAASAAPVNAVVASEQAPGPPPPVAPSQQTASAPPAVASTVSPSPVAVPAESGKGRLFIIIGGILIVIGVPAWLILSRSRGQTADSLITEGLKKR
jgi:hypothetical protein